MNEITISVCKIINRIYNWIRLHFKFGHSAQKKQNHSQWQFGVNYSFLPVKHNRLPAPTNHFLFVCFEVFFCFLWRKLFSYKVDQCNNNNKVTLSLTSSACYSDFYFDHFRNDYANFVCCRFWFMIMMNSGLFIELNLITALFVAIYDEWVQQCAHAFFFCFFA